MHPSIREDQKHLRRPGRYVISRYRRILYEYNNYDTMTTVLRINHNLIPPRQALCVASSGLRLHPILHRILHYNVAPVAYMCFSPIEFYFVPKKSFLSGFG